MTAKGKEGIRLKARVRMVRKHLYRISQRKPGVFTTEKSIAHPESRQALKKELSKGEITAIQIIIAIIIFDVNSQLRHRGVVPRRWHLVAGQYVATGQ